MKLSLLLFGLAAAQHGAQQDTQGTQDIQGTQDVQQQQHNGAPEEFQNNQQGQQQHNGTPEENQQQQHGNQDGQGTQKETNQLESSSNAACGAKVTRKELRDLTSFELSIFLNATKQFHSNSAKAKYESQVHLDNAAKSHGTPYFLPWHRMYVNHYERELQKIDSRVVLPYWDWSMDSQSPERSPILTKEYFGGNGRKGDGCVDSGPFADLMVEVPNKHCLCREFDSGNLISSFYAPEAIEVILAKSTTFEQFRTRIEAAPHARVHSGLGGSKGDIMTMYSSNDPLFFMHHSFIDLLWQEWQLRHPEEAKSFPTPDEVLQPFNFPVKDAMDYQNQCHSYPRYNVNLPSANKVQRRQLGGLLSGGDSGLGGLVTKTVGAVADTVNDVLDGSLLSGLGLDLKNLLSIEPLDRSTRHKIRKTQPVPDAYLTMNNMDVAKCRAIEKELNTLVSAYNKMEGFQPKAKLL